MKPLLILYLLSILLVSSCSLIKQHAFLERKTLFKNGEEAVFYEVYQTGVDNYDVLFYSSFRGDTSKMLNYNVDDALYTALRLETRTQQDTLFIETNMPTTAQKGVTVAGTKWYLKRKN